MNTGEVGTRAPSFWGVPRRGVCYDFAHVWEGTRERLGVDRT